MRYNEATYNSEIYNQILVSAVTTNIDIEDTLILLDNLAKTSTTFNETIAITEWVSTRKTTSEWAD